MKRSISLILAALIYLSGCTMAPQYTRPDAPVPAAWPQGPAYQESAVPVAPAAAKIGRAHV